MAETGTEPRAESRILQLTQGDNVAVAIREIEAGEIVRIHGREILPPRAIEIGEKFAARNIARGESMQKYGTSIGVAARDLLPGEPLEPGTVVEAIDDRAAD